MAKVNRYFPQVGLPSGQTQPQARYDTPVADTIGRIAGVAETFAQKYQEAQYSQDKAETTLQIEKAIHAYQENLRENPIIKQSPDDDLVALKEADWKRFSDNEIKNNVIGKLKDPRLKEDMNSWWNNQTEQIRSGVVNAAMDENIAYMAERRKELVDTKIYDGDYAGAVTLAENAVKIGLMTREQLDDVKDRAKLGVVIDTAKGMSLKDAEAMVDISDLEATEKAKAKKYIKDRKIVEKAEIKKATQKYLDENSVKFYSNVQNRVWTTKEEIDQNIKNLKDAEYKGQVIPGTAAKFGADNQVKLYAVLHQLREDDKKKDKKMYVSAKAKDILSSIFMGNGQRPELLNALYTLHASGDVNQAGVDYYLKEADKKQYPVLNNTKRDDFEKSLNDLVKDKIITTDQKGVVRSQWLDHIKVYSKQQAFEEKYYDDMSQFFNNIRTKDVADSITNANIVLREKGNFTTVNEPERYLERGDKGLYLGLVDTKSVMTYINSVKPDENALKDNAAQYLYGKNFDELKENYEKNKVNLSVSTAKYSKAVQQLADHEIGSGGRIAIDPKGMPIIKYGTGDNVKAYKLEMNPDGKEEIWYTYGSLNGREGWYPATEINKKIPDREKTPSMIGSLFKEAKKAAETINTTLDNALTPKERTNATDITNQLKQEAKQKYSGLPGF